MTHWLLSAFEATAENIAIVDNSGSYTYRELLDRVYTHSTFLEQHFVPGEKIILKSDYNIDSIAVFLAFSLSELIVIPVITDNTSELEEKIASTQADAILSWNNTGLQIKRIDSQKPEKNPLCQTILDKRHSGLILFSSGSTGKPKAMLHDLSVLLDTYKNKKRKKLSILVFLMFDHIGGINTLFNSLAMGARTVIPGNRNPETIAKIIDTEKVNILPSSPTFLNLLLLSGVLEKYNFNSVRMITYGTEPMPESLLLRIKEHFPRAKLLQTFGTSETGIAQVNSRSSSSLEIKIDDPNLEYKVVDGELWLKSKTRILGYLNATMENFNEDGWFCTGDLVKESEDGYLTITGRLKEVINVGGEKVLPAEVESHLLAIEGVQECIVYAQDNAITGQMVVADIVKAGDCDEKQLKKQIKKECFRKMERYKVPSRINFKNHVNISQRFKKLRLETVKKEEEIEDR